jgi:hypothetical protein
MFKKKMRFTGEIGNGNVPLDQTISAYRSICQAIVASDEDARRAMFTIFSDAALSYFYEHDTEWYSVSEVFAGLRGIFYDVAIIEQLGIEWTEYTWLRVKSDNPNIKDNHALLRCLLIRERELKKQLPVDGYGADVQLRNFLHRCTRHASFSAYMPTIKSETSGLYMTYLNLATERLRTATFSPGQQRPRQVMTLFGDGYEDGNSNIYDDALEKDHGDDSCYYQERTGPGYETQYKKNDYSRGNAYFRSGGNSSSDGELAPPSFRTNPRIAQRVVKTSPRVRFPGLKEFGTSESDSGPPKQPCETLNKTIGGVVMQCHKCNSRYHLFLKCPEGGRSEKVNYISMMMYKAEHFSERDPGELLAKNNGDFFYDDLDHNVVTYIENSADYIYISCVNLVDKHNDDTCDVHDGVYIDT